ncbi:Uma2 family endonuclease [Acidisphaera sp. S103]|uniref:Uma2 family endonuclease n=1 Tax=Acidisphaera sp. S103 TaxID=1747223 RepID=UPI00131B242A|nr:Uma2 family endonuclease [Acidisphaera sp. S103]
MSIALRAPMSLEEFLAWEERQEFDGFEPVATTGGTSDHSAIERNLIFSLTGRLRGKPCQPYTSNLKIFVAGSIRCPDAFVVCSPIPRGTLVVTEPVVVFEVLSPSTASTDIGVKNEEYRDTPSVKRYVMLAQDRQLATVFTRVGDDWVGHIVSGDAILGMPEIGIDVPLAGLYERVSFDQTAEPDVQATVRL